MNRFVVMTLALLVSAGPALADDFTATLAQPASKSGSIVAGTGAWSCEQTSCVAKSSMSSVNSILACRQLSRAVGTITAYGTKDALFTADQIEKCNSH